MIYVVELAKSTQDYSKGFGRVERLIDMALNIKQAYRDTEPEMKLEYLDLFFSKF